MDNRTDGPTCLFPIDPASQGDARDYRYRRPSRSEAVLQAFCEPIPLNTQRQLKQSPEDPNFMRVGAAAQFVQEDTGAQPENAKNVYLSGDGPEVHSNQFSADSATNNFQDFSIGSRPTVSV